MATGFHPRERTPLDPKGRTSLDPRGRNPLDPRGRTRNGCSKVSALTASISWDSFSMRQSESKDHEQQLAAVIPQSRPLCGTTAHRCTASNTHEIRITPKPSFWWLWNSMWVLGTGLRSPARTTNHPGPLSSPLYSLFLAWVFLPS